MLKRFIEIDCGPKGLICFAKPCWLWIHSLIDEIQKIPALLDEVHLMIERSGISFALCGSSARKLKRGHANLQGIEVDFIVGDLELAVEAKSSRKITSDHLKGLRQLRLEYPEVQQMIVVCLESQARITDDGILILPYLDFVKRLWGKQLL